MSRALRALGRRLDDAKPLTSMDGWAGGPTGPAGPQVKLDLADRLVLLKPVDWEVQDENVENLGCYETNLGVHGITLSQLKKLGLDPEAATDGFSTWLRAFYAHPPR